LIFPNFTACPSSIQTQSKKTHHEAINIDGSIVLKNPSTLRPSLASAVEEQNAATQEIALSVAEASSGTSMVTENISAVSQSTENVRNSARTVLEAAAGLDRQSEEMREAVDTFLAKTGAKAS